MNKTAAGSQGAPMNPLPSDNAGSMIHVEGSVSLAPVFTPHGRLTLSPALEAPLLDAATAGRLQQAFTRGPGHGLLQRFCRDSVIRPTKAARPARSESQ